MATRAHQTGSCDGCNQQSQRRVCSLFFFFFSRHVVWSAAPLGLWFSSRAAVGRDRSSAARARKPRWAFLGLVSCGCAFAAVAVGVTSFSHTRLPRREQEQARGRGGREPRSRQEGQGQEGTALVRFATDTKIFCLFGARSDGYLNCREERR